MKRFLSLILLIGVLPLFGQEFSEMDVLKTFQYIYDKLPGLNPPDFAPEKAGVVLEDGVGSGMEFFLLQTMVIGALMVSCILTITKHGERGGRNYAEARASVTQLFLISPSLIRRRSNLKNELWMFLRFM